MTTKFVQFLVCLSCCLVTGSLTAQRPQVSKVITVRDGLPQSYVSGIIQDKNGFLWIGTLNGFSRYDGRVFKHYWHSTTDSASLSSNIILHLLDAGNGQLLLCYMDGGLDLFDTESEKVVRLGNQPSFRRLGNEWTYFRSLVTNRQGLCWMLASDGGINQLDIYHNRLDHFTPAQLQLDSPVAGLSFHKDNIYLFAKSSLSIRAAMNGHAQTISYPFKIVNPPAFKPGNYYLPWCRENGELIIPDRNGITVWNPVSGEYRQIPLLMELGTSKFTPPVDRNGNYFFEYNADIYTLRPDNSITLWSAAGPSDKSIPTNLYIDDSGVLWEGTNGYGLRQYNLAKSGIPGYSNQHSFVLDVLQHFRSGKMKPEINFLGNSVPFSNRTASWKDQVWIADVNHESPGLQLALFSRGILSVKTFHSSDPAGKNEAQSVKFICFDNDGHLWGIDQEMRLLSFNTGQLSYTACSKIALDPSSDINGLVRMPDGSFYISSPKNLVWLDSATGASALLTGSVPSKDILSISTDPDDNTLLWIGTLSDGLLRFNTATRKTTIYSRATGLPNNTIYSIIPGNDYQLWCSSNKGVFAFNKKTGTIRSFTSRDGLIDDEFNRYAYMILPDSSIAFGGSLGYTIFKRETLQADGFDPQVSLTELTVPGLQQLPAPPVRLRELQLSYNQNFITASFAAMQFDFPDKIQYRYQLTGFDKDWIITGNENKALYTSLPPGNYTLLLNASNTSGKWSSHMLKIHIVIAPPFWKTWWFYAVTALVLLSLIYLFLATRIRNIQKAHAQQLQFEREAIELHAMALRAQMNPHFIFNCLNSIKAMIQEKQDKHAIQYLTTFVALIRKQLNNTSNQVLLAEELQTCKLYLELEAMRFEGRIRFDFDIAAGELAGQVMVPPLTLQAVVENAVIHGLLPKEDGGDVDIKVYRNNGHIHCEVKDNGIGRVAASALKQKSSRIHESKGIHLLKERVALHNLIHQQDDSIETTDLYNANGEAAGTLVTFKFKRV